MKARQRRSPSELDILTSAARQVLTNSHSPYSGYRVAAAVLTEDGQVFSGCNVENASYGATVCAERVAIWKAVSEGSKRLAAVLVLSEAREPWAPCGLCRQVMLEFATKATPVYMVSTKGKKKRMSLAQLCPASFSASQLK